ncbi:helix-turn-helix domain-containing protein [Ottowia sp.]|uniref:IclR family transcriptional regulator n=1 Tax=Ottowia sp. TaxID=1898956 RepID=UPI0025FDB34F|nr:helix-turn-helix domain-containing protein [Ottowia sp.]MBK6746998.1 helix-turn-helix domain-containing protein [Ottowia sp.]
MHESRRLSRETGSFVRVTPGSQSLARGIQVLRAFLEAAPSLSNSELVVRTHLPKATVSRLCRSLVDAGMLEFDPDEEAYRLAPSSLSLGRAFQFSRSELGTVNGVLKTFAREHQVNVGLSAPDHGHMVYVTTFRESRGAQTRTVASGLRLPMATCSPGIAYLASANPKRRATVYGVLETYHDRDWPAVRSTLEQNIADAIARGYSQATSVFGNAGLGASVKGRGGAAYAVSASYLPSVGLPPDLTVEKLGEAIVALAHELEKAWGGPQI